MLRKEFETWLADHIPNKSLLILGIHVSKLRYLKNRPIYFTNLLDGDMRELNKTLGGLENAATIPNNNNEHAPDLFNSKAK